MLPGWTEEKLSRAVGRSDRTPIRTVAGEPVDESAEASVLPFCTMRTDTGAGAWSSIRYVRRCLVAPDGSARWVWYTAEPIGGPFVETALVTSSVPSTSGPWLVTSIVTGIHCWALRKPP